MYIYERYNFRMFTMLFVLMVVIFAVYLEFIGAGISLLFAVFSSISYQGVRIDANQGKYINYDRFLWVRIGRWHSLPTPSYVTIVRINLSSKRTVPSPIVLPEDKKGAKSYKVNLVVEGDQRYIPVCRGSLEKMMPEALKLGKHLNVRVLDFTTHEKKWIL